MNLHRMISNENRLRAKRILPHQTWNYLRRQFGNRRPTLFDVVGKYLPQNPVIVEAGANDGSSTLDLAKQWPKARIFAFEPVPAVFEQLKSTVRGLPNVVCTNCALGEREANMTMSLSSNNFASSSLLRPTRVKEYFSHVGFVDEVTVPVVNLQNWLAARGIHHVDLMWLDLQGYEPLVFASSPELMRTVKVIQTEVNLVEIYEGAVLYNQFRSDLETAGFDVIEESLGESQGDIICVRSVH